ncbi:MAG: hypothetical protein JSU05_02115 [Bacteroidetes bacterium]|nr:hypothetical protein [Bacteroidota bacterium]
MFIVLAGILIALSLFYYMDQKRKIRNEEKHEQRMERLRNLLDVIKKKNNEQKDEVSDTTEDE